MSFPGNCWKYRQQMKSKTKILQLVDSLSSGGAERVAVNLANILAANGYDMKLCSTRKGGILENDIEPDVEYFCLNRRYQFDLSSFSHLLNYVRKNNIQIIHAHGTSLFIANIIKIIIPRTKIIWHVHHGSLAVKKQHLQIYRLLTHNLDGVITVNEQLSKWAITKLRISQNRVWYLPNFVIKTGSSQPDILPGRKGHRILCVANLRPPKDHLTLIRAMKTVVSNDNEAHLLLVGSDSNIETKVSLFAEIDQLELGNHITWLGARNDAQNIMSNCDIGVLSSSSEGLPLALLEYGIQNLPVVCTRVGECPRVVDNGLGGLLVEPNDPDELAQSIIRILLDPELGMRLSSHLETKIKNFYSSDAIIPQLVRIYDVVLS